MLVLRKRLYEILEGDRLSAPPLARAVNGFIFAVIVLSVLVVILESHTPTYEAQKELFIALERLSISFFTFEFLLRIWAHGAAYDADNGGARRGRFEYLKSFYGIVDLLAIAPIYLQFIFPGVDLLVLRILRLLRLLKLSRYNSALEDLLRAIKAERYSFFATLYIILIVMILSSALMYYAESAAQPEKLASILHAMYWSLITLTTVGYGDISPVTPIGKLISSFTALLGVATVAIFTGIIASSFSRQLERRRMIYEQELEKAYEDGVLSKDEEAFLAELRTRFDLSEEEVEGMRKRAIRSI